MVNDRIPNAHFLVAYDGLVSMLWCKHEFQHGRSNFNGKFVRFKGFGAKNVLRNFEKRLETAGTEQTFEKAARN